MSSIARQSSRRAVVLAVAAAFGGLAFALLASSPALEATPREAGCGPHVDSTPDEATTKQLRKALRCLVNQERADRNRRRVRSNRPLAGIARRHSKVMVSEDCFTHQCPGERPLRERIEKSDYVAGGGRYGYGENLGCSTTPRGMIAKWMETVFHRKTILNRRFRHVGVGPKRGSPFPRGGENCSPGREYVTYTVIFGWRKPKS